MVKYSEKFREELLSGETYPGEEFMTDEQNAATPSGVVVVITCRGVEVATASDFSDGNGSYDIPTIRARQKANKTVIDACCHPDVAKVISNGYAEIIVRQLVAEHGWKVHVVHVGDE